MYSKKTTTTTTSSSVGQPMTRTTVTQQSSGMPEMYMTGGMTPLGMVRPQFTTYGGVPTTTTYVSGPMMPTMMGPTMMSPMSTGAATTTTTHSSFPGFVQAPMMHTSVPFSTRSIATPTFRTSGWRTLGSPSWLGGFNGMSVMSTAQPTAFTSAPMSLMGVPTNMQTATRQASASTFSSSSSLNINGVHCEGLLEVYGPEIVRAKNLFIGDAPFQLSGDFLTLSPEHVVMASDPHIKCHIADIPNPACQSLNMEHLKTMLHEAIVQHNQEAQSADPSFKAPEINLQNLQVHIGLPGQSSNVFGTDSNGHLKSMTM